MNTPKYLDDARLTFFQKYKLVQSLIDYKKDRRIWLIIQKLNEIRNKIAHNIEVDIDEQVNNFINIYQSPKLDKMSRSDKIKLIKIEVSKCYGFLLHIVNNRLVWQAGIEDKPLRRKVSLHKL